jgi:photosystem II stability/assembly factor-like uncharacterized protein
LTQALAIRPDKPDTLLASLEDAPLLISEDAGRTWTRISEGLDEFGFDGFAFDSRAPATVFGAATGDLLKSTNGGRSWREIGKNTFVEDAEVACVAVDPQRGVVLAGTDGAGVYKSLNGGRTWKGTRGLGGKWLTAIAIDPKRPAVIYAGTFRSGVFKSTNGGATWKAVSGWVGGRAVYALAIDPSDTRNVFVGTGSGVVTSGDNGRTWQHFRQGLPPEHVLSLAFGADGSVLYAGTSRSVYKSTR